MAWIEQALAVVEFASVKSAQVLEGFLSLVWQQSLAPLRGQMGIVLLLEFQHQRFLRSTSLVH